jgi:hypothetical protein
MLNNRRGQHFMAEVYAAAEHQQWDVAEAAGRSLLWTGGTPRRRASPRRQLLVRMQTLLRAGHDVKFRGP